MNTDIGIVDCTWHTKITSVAYRPETAFVERGTDDGQRPPVWIVTLERDLPKYSKLLIPKDIGYGALKIKHVFVDGLRMSRSCYGLYLEVMAGDKKEDDLEDWWTGDDAGQPSPQDKYWGVCFTAPMKSGTKITIETGKMDV